MADLKYLPAGIRLHLKELIYKITDDLRKYYYFHFEDIPTGLKAEKLLKKENIKSIPTPDEIFDECGISILTTEKDKIEKILKEADINYEIWIFDKKFKKIKGNIKNKSCKI